MTIPNVRFFYMRKRPKRNPRRPCNHNPKPGVYSNLLSRYPDVPLRGLTTPSYCLSKHGQDMLATISPSSLLRETVTVRPNPAYETGGSPELPAISVPNIANFWDNYSTYNISLSLTNLTFFSLYSIGTPDPFMYFMILFFRNSPMEDMTTFPL